MYDSYLTDKDHLAEWDFENTWPKAMAMFTIAHMPVALHTDMALGYIRAMKNMRDTAATWHQLDDVLLAFKAFEAEGPRPLYMDPNYVPPKRTLRIRFRIWRHDLNHRVQQWIHDHLDEAWCDE
jgi:hypothetical protein